jgi:hypothetical protein
MIHRDIQGISVLQEKKVGGSGSYFLYHEGIRKFFVEIRWVFQRKLFPELSGGTPFHEPRKK